MNRYDSPMIGNDESRVKPYEIALETSGTAGGVALGCRGRLVDVRTFAGPRLHAGELLPTISALCRDHDVPKDRIGFVFVSMGPGSFTGLRIGITVARTMALGLGVQVVGVPTMDVVAQNAIDMPKPPQEMAVIIDAMRKRIFAACFVREGDRYRPTSAPAEVDPAVFLESLDPDVGVTGEGVGRFEAEVRASGLALLPLELCTPRAETVLRLGWGDGGSRGAQSPRSLVPLYIRLPEAEEKWAQRARGGSDRNHSRQ